MSPRKSRTVPADRADAMRWKLELTGTSTGACRELEAVVAGVSGWQHLQTRTEHQLGVTRIYMVTGSNESPEHILSTLDSRSSGHLPSVTRLELTTWETVGKQLRATRDARIRHGGARVTVPSG